VGYIFAANSLDLSSFEFPGELRKISIAQCVMTVHGQPRSMTVSSERAYATSY